MADKGTKASFEAKAGKVIYASGCGKDMIKVK